MSKVVFSGLLNNFGCNGIARMSCCVLQRRWKQEAQRTPSVAVWRGGTSSEPWLIAQEALFWHARGVSLRLSSGQGVTTNAATIFCNHRSEEFQKDAAFLLTVGSFLLTIELFYLQLCFWAFLLTARAFLLTIELLCLQWESVYKKHLNGL